MKTGTLIKATALALAAAVLAGCSGGGSAGSLQSGSINDYTYGEEYDSIEEAFPVLLARDYEVYYQYYFGGMKLDYSADDGSGYIPVLPESGFGTLADLRAWLLNTYTPDGADAILQASDSEGKPLFIEREGALLRSTASSGAPMLSDCDEDGISYVTQGSDRVLCSFAVTDINGAAAQQQLVAAKNADGHWRLETPRVWQEGNAAEPWPSGGSPVSDATVTARQAAEGFLDALTTANISGIEFYSGMPSGTYSAWKGLTVLSAAITDSLYEQDDSAYYLVSMNVKNAYGLLMPGKSTYRLILRSMPDGSDGLRPTVVYFQPSTVEPYNYRQPTEQNDPACDQVMAYLMLYGEQGFASASELTDREITEFTLYMLSQETTAASFSREELEAGILKYFGLSGTQPDESFYSSNAGGYILMGRGGVDIEYELLPSSAKSGATTVTVNFYDDHLQTQGQRTLDFRMTKNADGSYRFISAQ